MKSFQINQFFMRTDCNRIFNWISKLDFPIELLIEFSNRLVFTIEFQVVLVTKVWLLTIAICGPADNDLLIVRAPSREQGSGSSGEQHLFLD